MTKQTKLNLQLFTAVFVVVLGSCMSIAGFIVAPTGVIHPSVLTHFGECLTFAGALFGVDYTYRYKIYNRNIK